MAAESGIDSVWTPGKVLMGSVQKMKKLKKRPLHFQKSFFLRIL